MPEHLVQWRGGGSRVGTLVLSAVGWGPCNPMGPWPPLICPDGGRLLVAYKLNGPDLYSVDMYEELRGLAGQLSTAWAAMARGAALSCHAADFAIVWSVTTVVPFLLPAIKLVPMAPALIAFPLLYC